MKSERRHELQQNSLAHVLENLPLYLRHYADRILLVVVLILLAVVVVRWRINAGEQREAQIADDLAMAKSSLQNLMQLPPNGPPDQLASVRGQLIGEITGGIENVANNSSDKDSQMRAQALLTRGDLYWTLSNLPPIKGAATQPSLALPKSADEYLQSSEDAYRLVISTYPNEKVSVVAANFGLGAIAENRRKWDDAQHIYEQIKNSDADKMYKDMADMRLKLLPEMKQTLLYGSLTTRPTETEPLVFAPPPSTAPIGVPTSNIAPATLPVAAPPAAKLPIPATVPAVTIPAHPTTQPAK